MIDLTDNSPETTRLIAKAIRDRWPIADKWRAALINRQIRIALDPETPKRDATTAFKSILTADAQNMAAEQSGTMPVHSSGGGQHLHFHGPPIPADTSLDEIKRAIIDRIGGSSANG